MSSLSTDKLIGEIVAIDPTFDADDLRLMAREHLEEIHSTLMDEVYDYLLDSNPYARDEEGDGADE